MESNNLSIETTDSSCSKSETVGLDSSFKNEIENVNILWEHVNIETNWGTIRAKKCGNGTRKILAVHGWLDNANTFDLIAPYMYKYCTFLSIDLPGHGWSDHFPSGFIYDKRSYVGTIKKVITNLGWTKFTFLGHSMGAVVGIFYSAVFPEDIESLISIDIIKPWSLKPKDYAAAFKKNLLNYFKNEKLSNLSPIEYNEEELMIKTIEGDNKSLDEKSARILLERSTKISSCGKKRILSRDLRVKAYFIGFISFEGWYEFAKAIKTPILIIKGKQGHVYEEQADYDIMLEAFKDGSPFYQYEVLEGKHHLHLTNSENVGPVVEKFLINSEKYIKKENV